MRREGQLHARAGHVTYHPPLLREAVLPELLGVVPVGVEHFRELRRDGRFVEEERVVGLDVEATQREVRRAAERSNSLAVAPDDEDLVVLLAAEVHALSLRAGRKQSSERDRLRAGVVRLFGVIVDDRAQPPAEPLQAREDVAASLMRQLSNCVQKFWRTANFCVWQTRANFSDRRCEPR